MFLLFKNIRQLFFVCVYFRNTTFIDDGLLGCCVALKMEAVGSPKILTHSQIIITPRNNPQEHRLYSLCPENLSGIGNVARRNSFKIEICLLLAYLREHHV